MYIDEFKEKKEKASQDLDRLSRSNDEIEEMKILFLDIFEIYKKNGFTMVQFEQIVKDL
jgi:hypothetical protein